jgi:hypothetical protein
MAIRTILRPAETAAGLGRRSNQLLPSLRRCFQTSRALAINVGDQLPRLGEVLMEDTPGNKLDLAAEIEKKGGDALIIGVPAAFSGVCSATHIPSYMKHPSTREFPLVAVVSVNDAFV